MTYLLSQSEPVQINSNYVRSPDDRLRGIQLLMAHPFFSLSKTPRLTPIDYANGTAAILVEATGVNGIATIWDADILIWAASQIMRNLEFGNTGRARLIETRPHEILSTLDWGHSKRSYERLRAGLARLSATRITTSLGPGAAEGLRHFHWIDEWRELKDSGNRSAGLEIILSEWLYGAIVAPGGCLSINKDFFYLTGGLQRWLYLLIRKHGGFQEDGWQFDLHYLYLKSGLLSRFVAFASEIRRIVRRQSIPGYELSIAMNGAGKEVLRFKNHACGKAVDSNVLSRVKPHVLTRTKGSWYRWSQSSLTRCNQAERGSRKIYSKIDPKYLLERDLVNNASSEATPKRQNPSAFDLGDEAKHRAHGSSIIKSFSELESLSAILPRSSSRAQEPQDRKESPPDRFKQGPSPSLLHSRLFRQIADAGDAQ
jgi:plasmid replication initiation protein